MSRRLMLILICLTVCTHLIAILWMGERGIVYDTRSYFVETHRLATGEVWGGQRAHAYPLLLALTTGLTGTVFSVQLAAVLLAGAASAATMLLAERVRKGAGVLAGILFAFLPSSLLLVGWVVPEAISGYTVVIAVYGVVARKWGIWLFGLLASQLLRQHLAPLGILVLVPIAYWSTSARRVRYAVVVGALSLVVPLGQTLANYSLYGVLNPYGNSASVWNYYTVAVVQARGNDQAFAALQREMQDDLSRLSTAEEANAYHNARSRAVMNDVGIITFLQVMGSEMVEQVLAPPGGVVELPLVAQQIRIYSWILMLACAVAGTLSALLQRRWWVAWLFVSMALFALPGAMQGGWSGARLRLPGDILFIPLVASVLLLPVGARIRTRTRRRYTDEQRATQGAD